MSADQDHAAMQQSPAEKLSDHHSSGLPPTSLLEDSNPVTIQLQNSGNTCFAAVVVSLLASSPAFIQFITTVVDRYLILWKGDLVQELQALTTLGSLQVND